MKDEPIYQVVLFGSYAKQEANKHSDIDLIIDSKSQLKGFALMKVICMIEERFKKMLMDLKNMKL